MIFLPFLFYVALISASSSLSVRQTTVTSSIDWNPKETPYPVTRRENVSFTYSSALNGSIDVPDYYHWFEDSEASMDEIQTFTDGQTAFMQTYLKKSQSELDLIKASFLKAEDYTWGDIHHEIYYIATQDEMDQGITQNFSTFPGQQVLDTGLVGVNKTAFTVRISPDGSKMIYKVADRETSANETTYVRPVFPPLLNSTVKENVEGGEGHFVNDVIFDNGDTYSIWHPDGKSLFYGTTTYYGRGTQGTPDEKTVRYHVLGTDVKDDIIIAPPLKEPFTDYDFEVSDDSKYIFVFVFFNYTENCNVYVASLDQPITSSSSLKWLPVVTDAADNLAHYDFAASFGSDFYFYRKKDGDYDSGDFIMTRLDFGNAKAIDKGFNELPSNDLTAAKVIIPEKPGRANYWAGFDTNKILIGYTIDDHPELIIYDMSTGQELEKIVPKIPFLIEYFNSHPLGDRIFLFAQLTDTPQLLLHFKYTANQETKYQIFYQTKNDYVDHDQFVEELQWVASKDGTQVPFFILYPKDIQFDGTNPAMIQFDGEFGQTAFPCYYDHVYSFVHDYKGIHISAGPRGGSDAGGNVWHEAGVQQNKHHTFEDVIAIAEHLVNKKYTSDGKIILYGEQYGGMASMAVVNQARQGLFGALMSIKGIYDMLRFDQSPLAGERIAEYGDPHNATAFDWLYGYSPLHNVNKDKIYPLILLIKSDWGSAEVWHAYKMLAELQFTLPQNPNPFLFVDNNVEYKEQQEIALAIIAHALGLKRFD